MRRSTPTGGERLKLHPITHKSPPRNIQRCPMERYRPQWCKRLCSPIGDLGQCGRLAPHAMLDRTQRAIAARATKRAEAEAAKS